MGSFLIMLWALIDENLPSISRVDDVRLGVSDRRQWRRPEPIGVVVLRTGVSMAGRASIRIETPITVHLSFSADFFFCVARALCQ